MPTPTPFVVAVCAALTLGCEADKGVSITVTAQADAFSPGHPFDWVELTATQGHTVARACLFPTADHRSRAPDEGRPCADYVREVLDSELTLAQWDFASGSRVVNVVAAAEGPVHVVATAGFGSEPVARGEALGLVPEADFTPATIELALTATEDLWPEGAALGEPKSSAAPPNCQAASIGCAETSGTPGAICIQAADGTVTSMRFSNERPDESCESAITSASLPFVDGDLRLSLAGHFAACTSGTAGDASCDMTIDCQPQSTSMTLFYMRKECSPVCDPGAVDCCTCSDKCTECTDAKPAVATKLDLDSLPRSVNPVWLATDFSVETLGSGYQRPCLFVLRITQQPVAAPDGRPPCFLEVTELSINQPR